ncbi:hypothetical protein EJ110_NYTH08758 [Nymphaea thermarum]|nr:hypothetical protein EJ110_NYTH08758 [Nymphaea thermarum]
MSSSNINLEPSGVGNKGKIASSKESTSRNELYDYDVVFKVNGEPPDAFMCDDHNSDGNTIKRELPSSKNKEHNNPQLSHVFPWHEVSTTEAYGSWEITTSPVKCMYYK